MEYTKISGKPMPLYIPIKNTHIYRCRRGPGLFDFVKVFLIS